VEVLAMKVQYMCRICIEYNWGMNSIFMEFILEGRALDYTENKAYTYLDIPPVTPTVYIIPHRCLFPILHQEFAHGVPLEYLAEVWVLCKFQNPVHDWTDMDDKFFINFFPC
jgi:hypothetical protein